MNSSMKVLVQVLNSTAQLVLELLIIIPISKRYQTLCIKKLALKHDACDNWNACKMPQSYAKVE